MIEISIKVIDGVNFIDNMKVLEPDSTWEGVPVHRVEGKYRHANDLLFGLRMLGLRKVGFDFSRRADLYTSYPVDWFRAKVNHAFIVIYWAIIRWLYNNARFFKQIPESQPFSWRYFTPFTWFKH